MVLVTGYCYFRGHRQSQSRARHAEVLHFIISGVTHNVSTHQRTQSGAYPGSSSPEIPQAPSASGGSFAHPVVKYLASTSTTSCGLPGCSTSYPKPVTISLDTLGHASHLPLSYDPAAWTISVVDRRPCAPPPSNICQSQSSARLASTPLPADAPIVSSPDSPSLHPASSVRDFNWRSYSTNTCTGSVHNLMVRF